MTARVVHAGRSRGTAKAQPSPQSSARPASAAPVSNQRVQAGLRAAPLLGRLGDPEEAAADRLADAAMRGAPRVGLGGRGSGAGMAQTGGGGGRPARGGLFADGGRALDAGTRRFFEPHFGDLATVRVHDDDGAASAARAIGARAFAHGTDIGFARGAFTPGAEAGRRLLAHELAHVASGHSGVRRQPDPTQPPSGPPGPGPQPDGQAQPAPGPLIDPSLGADARVDAFKALVKTTAIHRLNANSRNLGAWAALVESTVPATDLSVLALMQGGGDRAYYEMQDIRDPGLRELRAQQAFGHDRACTGCHIENQLWGSRSERQRDSLTPWRSPNEMRALDSLQPGGAPAAPGTVFFPQTGPGHFGAAPGGYAPPAGSAEAGLSAMPADPAQVRGASERVRLIIAELGPEHFGVLPGTLTGDLEAGGPERVRGQIIEAIRQRQIDYADLVGRIDDGDLGYEHFGPVIGSLLPLADPEVHARISDEMDSHHFWSLVESVVVGIATLAALLLMIFPPTSALGVAALTGLEMGLAAYGVAKAPEMISVGTSYGLAQGADDVLSRQQQDAGAMMVLGGVVSLLTGPLALFRGAARLGALAEGGAPSAALATTAGTAATRTVQQGDVLVTMAEDGSMVITSASHPDLVIMVRGNTATLYQSLEGGGLRVVGSASVPPPAPSVTPGAPLMLGPGEAVPEGPVIVDIQGGPAVRGDTGAPTFLPSVVRDTPGARGLLIEPGDYVPGYAGITTTNARDLAMLRLITQNAPRWPGAAPGGIGEMPPAWEWDPTLAFPTRGPVQVLTRAGAPGTTPAPQAFFPPLGGDAQGVPRLIPIAGMGRTAQQDVIGLQASTHPELHGTVDQMYWRRPFALGSADPATQAAIGQEAGRMLRPGGYLELRLLRGGEEAQAQAIAAQIPGARTVVVPRGAVLSYARSGVRPPDLTDEQWQILDAAGPDIRGEYGALGEGTFARIVRIYRGADGARPQAGQ